MEQMNLSNPEKSTIIEMKSNELISMIKNLKFSEWEIFEFNGVSYQIIWTNRKDSTNDDENYQDAWWSESTMIDGFDIYLQKSLSKEEKIRKLFHEILEINIRMQDVDNNKAHDLTLQEEERIFGTRKNINKNFDLIKNTTQN